VTAERRSAGPDARPPIRQRTTAGSDCAHTFAVFTARLGEWWPLVPFSVGRERIREVVLEPESGGRVYEVWEDGSTADWGRIIDWDPPRRFSMTWNATGTPTIVELEFRSLGPARTEVLLEHRGWEALSVRELGEDCALPGGYLGGSFTAGWTAILSAFEQALTNTEREVE